MAQELFQLLRHQTTWSLWEINLIRRSTLCGQVNCFEMKRLIVWLSFWFICWCVLALLSTCTVSFSSVGDGHSWFFYAWLKVQLHLSFSFPASRPASQTQSSKSWHIHDFMCFIYNFSAFCSLKFLWCQYWFDQRNFEPINNKTS